jgi:hypothetical protein
MTVVWIFILIVLVLLQFTIKICLAVVNYCSSILMITLCWCLSANRISDFFDVSWSLLYHMAGSAWKNEKGWWWFDWFWLLLDYEPMKSRVVMNEISFKLPAELHVQTSEHPNIQIAANQNIIYQVIVYKSSTTYLGIACLLCPFSFLLSDRYSSTKTKRNNERRNENICWL